MAGCDRNRSLLGSLRRSRRLGPVGLLIGVAPLTAAPTLAIPAQASPNADGRIPAILLALLVVLLLGAGAAALFVYRRRTHRRP